MTHDSVVGGESEFTDPTKIWVRPREEFEDGRFEPLSAIVGSAK